MNAEQLFPQLVRIPVAEKPYVRCHCFIAQILLQLSKHPLLRSCTQNPMIGEMHPSEKIDARRKRFYCDLVWMQREPQLRLKKFGDSQ